MKKGLKNLLFVFAFLAVFFVFDNVFAMKPRSQSADYVSKLKQGTGKCTKATYPAGFYTVENLESQYKEFFEGKSAGGKVFVQKLIDCPRHFKLIFHGDRGRKIVFEVKFSLCHPGEFEKEAEKYNEIVKFAKDHRFTGSDQMDFVDPKSRKEIEAQALAARKAKGTKFYDFTVCRSYGISMPDYSDPDSDSTDDSDDELLYGCEFLADSIIIPESLKVPTRNAFGAWK